MAGRLQLIEQKLIAIDPAGFQNLCDTYLTLRENEYTSLNRTGTQLGKQKTVLGTPDSFVRLEDNKLAYIEYTTQTDFIVPKIKEDIDKCLDESKTGVSPDQLSQIIVCFNSRLTIKEEVKIQQYAQSKSKEIELIGIDTLALEIFSKYPLLSRDCLGIPIDTGQILPLDKFITEYNNKAYQLSTPLDNDFLHRKEELEEIYSYLHKGDLLIISGATGVGKTKIAIEALNNFIKENTTYTSYAIAKKDVDIFEDLRIQLSVDRDYILLIDDANRQIPNLKQVLGVFKEERKGNLKIIITVRNYAVGDILKEINDLDKHFIYINKFTDEEIVQLISSDNFKILNSKYQEKIVEISDGNARLAIMAARLANKKPVDFLWGDVTSLFDSYFKTFITDFGLFENNTVLKVLGLISFFFTIDRKNKAFIQSLTELFDINYYDFNEAIEELHKRELIEVEFHHARISEQVMATYFFYKVFIKDGILSFNVLLNNFFADWKTRFKDSIIPATNSFGYDNVISKIGYDLSGYLKSISEDETAVLNFLDLFCFYMPEDTMAYFYSKISTLSEPGLPVYQVYDAKNGLIADKEQTLGFLSRFFNYVGEQFKPSIELAFELVRKKPQYQMELIRLLSESLRFDEEDEINGFKRQIDFIEILIENFNNKKPHYIPAFFALAKSFLAHSFHITRIRRRAVSLYDYPLPPNDVILKLRTKIWNTLFESFDSYQNEVLDVITAYRPMVRDVVPEIMDHDLSLLVPFISTKFSPSIFKQTYCVHEMIYWNDREERISNRSYRDLKQKFTTEEYLNVCKLDWETLRGTPYFEYDLSKLEEYDNHKVNELVENFVFTEELQFHELLVAIENIQSVKDINYFSISKSIDIVVEVNFRRNNELGFRLFQLIWNCYPEEFPLLNRTISLITSLSSNWCLRFWQELESRQNKNILDWRLSFFHYVPNEFIIDYYCEKLIETIESIDISTYLHAGLYYRYNLLDKHIVKTILCVVAQKNENHSFFIAYSDAIFKNNLDLFESDYNLIKLSYFQQFANLNNQVFDYEGKGFEVIFKQYPRFLVDFIEKFFTNNSEMKIIERSRNLKLGFIWKYNGLEEIIIRATDVLIENNYYLSLGGHPYSLLFEEINAVNVDKAFGFILEEIERHKQDVHRLDVYFDTIRRHFAERFEQALLFYLSVNSSVETFKLVDWVGNVGAQWGDVSFGDLYAKRWENILRIVNMYKPTIEMIPIKKYLKEKIANKYKFAEHERKIKFLTPNR